MDEKSGARSLNHHYKSSQSLGQQKSQQQEVGPFSKGRGSRIASREELYVRTAILVLQVKTGAHSLGGKVGRCPLRGDLTKNLNPKSTHVEKSPGTL